VKHYLYAMGAILCWASLPVATGTGLDALSIEELLFYSFTSAAIFLYALDLLQKKTVKLTLPGLQVSLLGIWGIFLYHYVYYQAMARAPLAEAAILATTWSFWIVVFSSLVTYRRLQPALIFVALVGLFGAGLVIAAGKELSFNSGSMLGYALALLCGLIWSSFSVGLSLLRLQEEPMTAFTLYAAVLSAVLFGITGPYSVPAPQALLSAIYLGCVPLGLSFFLWNRAVTGGNMAVIGLLSYCTPPLAVLLVALLRQQPVAPQVLLGMALIILAAMVGKYLLQKARTREM
jgi:drug/metabolite transporter (DMT)-like permease